MTVTYRPAIEKARKGSYILGVILFMGIGFAASHQMGSMLWGIAFGGLGAGGYVFLQGRKLDRLPSLTFDETGLLQEWPGGRVAIRWDEVASLERKGSSTTWVFRNKDGSKLPVRVLGFEPEDRQAIVDWLERRRDSLST